MHETTMDELKQLLANGNAVERYAWDHKDELTSREPVFTLYGPYEPGLGASIPCNTVCPKSARKLLHKTRRKDYIIYHLDENYQVIRTILVINQKVTDIFHHFELNGMVYAYEYELNLGHEIHFFCYEGKKPVIYGIVNCNRFLFVQFYEYTESEKMLVTTYRYTPGLKMTIDGMIPDPNAPIGAPNSFVHRRFYEETAENTDFSRWFQ